MTHPRIHPMRLLWQALLLTMLILLATRPAMAIDTGHLDQIKPEQAEGIFNAFIAPVYYLVDEQGAAVVTGFQNPLSTFVKPVQFAIVLYLDPQAAKQQAQLASKRDGRKYALRASTVARALKNLYQHKDTPASVDYQRPDFVIFENPTMQAVRPEYLIDDETRKPYIARVGPARYTPAFFSRSEAIEYQKHLRKTTGRSYTRVGQGFQTLLKFMSEHAGSPTQVRVFGYQAPALIANFETAVRMEIAARGKKADKHQARVLQRDDESVSHRIRRSGSNPPTKDHAETK